MNVRDELRWLLDYYRVLIKSDSLFDNAIGFYLDGTRCYDLAKADDLAVPVGGKRRSGMLEMTGDQAFPVQAARKIVKMLQKWPDRFPDVRLDRFDCYVEWGDPIPGLVQDEDDDVVLARGRQFGYSDEDIFEFLQLVHQHKGAPSQDATDRHIQDVVRRAKIAR